MSFCDDGYGGYGSYDDDDGYHPTFCEICNAGDFSAIHNLSEEQFNRSKDGQRCLKHKDKLTSAEMVYALDKLQGASFGIGFSLIIFSVGIAILLACLKFDFGEGTTILMSIASIVLIIFGGVGALNCKCTKSHVKRIIVKSDAIAR
jgi:hypothetical protein